MTTPTTKKVQLYIIILYHMTPDTNIVIVREKNEDPTSASVRSFWQSGLLYFSCMKGIQLNLQFLMNGLTSTVPRA